MKEEGMKGLKKWVMFLFLGAVVFLSLPLLAQSQHGREANLGVGGSIALAAEATPNFPSMPGPGKKVPRRTFVRNDECQGRCRHAHHEGRP